eukprot:3198335-Pyramimonas_sp.AAC.1
MDDMHGPVKIFLIILHELKWSLDADFVVTRPTGGNIHLLESDDLLFRHILRADLRKVVWKTGFHIHTHRDRHPRIEYFGTEVGIDYEATVQQYRQRRSNVKRHDAQDTPGGAALSPFKWSFARRAACRLLWSA